jgi:hypothetical protein
VLDEGTVGGDGEGPEAVELVGKVSRVVALLRQAGVNVIKLFYPSLMLRTNKLGCLSLAGLLNLSGPNWYLQNFFINFLRTSYNLFINFESMSYKLLMSFL